MLLHYFFREMSICFDAFFKKRRGSKAETRKMLHVESEKKIKFGQSAYYIKIFCVI